MWAWLRMLRRVPTGISCFFGTMAVSTTSPIFRTNLTWLPFWLASAKPAASSLHFTSRKGCGLSRPNLDLDHADSGWTCRLRRFKMKFKRFLKVGERLLFGGALAGDIDLEALRYVPVAFSPYSCRERSLHVFILPQTARFRSFTLVQLRSACRNRRAVRSRTKQYRSHRVGQERGSPSLRAPSRCCSLRSLS
jgi:hypothetical protein